MKKRITALLCATMLVGLCSCASKNKNADYEVGSIVQLGTYIQDGDVAEPIDWIVLTVEDDRALLVTEKIIDCQRYHSEYSDCTWETCYMREWLNSEFYSTAFSSEDTAKILETVITNEDNPTFGTEGGNDTTDRVFLLSYSEAESYLSEDSLRAEVTAYAISNGVIANDGVSAWWLRTPGTSGRHRACRVMDSGVIAASGCDVENISTGVRAAVWVSIE